MWYTVAIAVACLAIALVLMYIVRTASRLARRHEVDESLWSIDRLQMPADETEGDRERFK